MWHATELQVTEEPDFCYQDGVNVYAISFLVIGFFSFFQNGKFSKALGYV